MDCNPVRLPPDSGDPGAYGRVLPSATSSVKKQHLRPQHHTRALSDRVGMASEIKEACLEINSFDAMGSTGMTVT